MAQTCVIINRKKFQIAYMSKYGKKLAYLSTPLACLLTVLCIMSCWFVSGVGTYGSCTVPELESYEHKTRYHDVYKHGPNKLNVFYGLFLNLERCIFCRSKSVKYPVCGDIFIPQNTSFVYSKGCAFNTRDFLRLWGLHQVCCRLRSSPIFYFLSPQI